MSALFQPFTLRGLTLPSRIVISPLCEYSTEDGCATDWDVIHPGNREQNAPGGLERDELAQSVDHPRVALRPIRLFDAMYIIHP